MRVIVLRFYFLAIQERKEILWACPSAPWSVRTQTTTQFYTPLFSVCEDTMVVDLSLVEVEYW
jgi:hypothetical protein